MRSVQLTQPFLPRKVSHRVAVGWKKKKKKESRRRERAVENRESGYEAGNIVRETKQRGRLALQSVWGGGGVTGSQVDGAGNMRVTQRRRAERLISYAAKYIYIRVISCSISQINICMSDPQKHDGSAAA